MVVTRSVRPARVFWTYWFPALLWLALVAVFSSSLFGAGHSGGWLQSILRSLHLQLTVQQFESLHFLIRKGMHFFAYAVLSGLFFRALRGTESPLAPWRLQWAALALGVALLTSSSDEIHQAFTPGRTGTWHDVFLDMLGASFAQSVILVTHLNGSGRGASRRRPVPVRPTT